MSETVMEKRRMWPTPNAMDGSEVVLSRTPEQHFRRQAELKAKNPRLGELQMPLSTAVQLEPDVPTDSNQLTLFAEAFPANPIRWLADVPDRATTATSGRTRSELFAKFAPDGSCSKMFLDCCPVMLDGSIEAFSGPWPRAGSMRNGRLFLQPTWERRTDATASGSWPTPDSGAFNLTESPESVLARQAAQKARGINGNGFGLRLATAAQMRPDGCRDGASAGVAAPTPTDATATTACWSETGASVPPAGTGTTMTASSRMWPTPCAEDAKNVPYQKGDHGTRYPMLLGAVAPERMWPTPKARDWKDASSAGTFERSSPDLGKMVGQSAITGALNPTWVEWLMGYPLGWTACAALATRSSRRSVNGSRGASSPPKA